MAKFQKGKRRSSKKEKRQLRKKHKEDAPNIGDYREKVIREAILPKWEEQKKSETESVQKLSKKERRFLTVQRQLGIIEDVRKNFPMPAVVQDNTKEMPHMRDQKSLEEARKRVHGDGDVEMKDVSSKKTAVGPAAKKSAPQEKIQKVAESEETSAPEEQPEIYDLWENAKPKRKRNKAPKERVSGATQLLNTVLPHPGQSYNPDVSAYQHALSHAARTEAKKALFEQRIAKKLNPASSDPNVLNGGHDALDGIKAQNRALEQEANVTEDVLRERERISEELKKLHEKKSEPNPILPRSRFVGRKIHKIQLSKKQRKVYSKFQKKKTFKEELEETGTVLDQIQKREERRRAVKRRNKELIHSRAFASVVDARDIYLPEEMPTRMSNMGQNTTALLTAQMRSLHGLRKRLI